MINPNKMHKSFGHAFKGLKEIFHEEQNFRIHIYVSIVVILLMIIFETSLTESAILFLIIALVLSLEIINTTFEKIIDVLKPRFQDLVAIIKDLMAAAVLIASLGAVLIGLLIFYPYFHSTICYLWQNIL